MKNIDVKELIKAMDELEKERGIEKAYLIESLEIALVTAYKKNFDSVDNVKVVIDSNCSKELWKNCCSNCKTGCCSKNKRS